MYRRYLLRLSGATIASGLGFKNAVAQEAPTIRLLTDASVGVPFPVPKPMSKDDILPQNSNDIVIATGNAEFFLYAFSSYWQISAFNRFAPPLPPGLQLAYKMFWENVDSEHVAGPQTFSRTYMTKNGITVGDSQTLSA
jgi:hypothetical protein